MVTTRKATIDDIGLINEMAWKVFPLTYADILTPQQIDYMMDWMYSLPNLRKQMEEEGHVYYIAESDGTPAGYVSVQPEGADLYHLQKIYVLPEFRTLRVGRRLFEQAVEAVRAMHPDGPCTLELNVNRSNPAVGFYEHMGMHKDRQGDFPIGGGFYMNDYIMTMTV